MPATTVLISKADRLFSDFLCTQVRAVEPGAACTVVNGVAHAKAALELATFDLWITGLSAADGDGLDLIAQAMTHIRRAPAILVITTRREPRVITALRTLEVDGVFDSSTDGVENIGCALRLLLVERGHYWSPSLKEWFARPNAAHVLLRNLTPTERLILAAVGDGSDDATAAEFLGMKPSAVQAVRRSLHDKLHIQQKGELVRVAAQYGFVRFTAAGAVRVGFGMLLADYQAQSKRPLALPPKLAAEFPGAAAAAAARRQ